MHQTLWSGALEVKGYRLQAVEACLQPSAHLLLQVCHGISAQRALQRGRQPLCTHRAGITTSLFSADVCSVWKTFYTAYSKNALLHDCMLNLHTRAAKALQGRGRGGMGGAYHETFSLDLDPAPGKHHQARVLRLRQLRRRLRWEPKMRRNHLYRPIWHGVLNLNAQSEG